jgi:hypothetical protein
MNYARRILRKPSWVLIISYFKKKARLDKQAGC